MAENNQLSHRLGIQPIPLKGYPKVVASSGPAILVASRFDSVNPNFDWVYITRKSGDSQCVMCLLLEYNPQNGQSYAILSDQFRPPVANWSIETAGGSIEEGEEANATFARECVEEVGYAADYSETMPIQTAGSPGTMKENAILVLAYDAVKIAAGGGAKKEGENIKTIKVPLNKLMDFFITNQQKYAHYGLFAILGQQALLYRGDLIQGLHERNKAAYEKRISLTQPEVSALATP